MNDQCSAAECAIESLICCDEYVRLMQLKPEFDLFEVLGNLSENSSSRALAFLLDSNGEHGLGTEFFNALLWQVHKERRRKPFRLGLRNVLDLKGSETSAVTEWSTSARRRLDILVKSYGEDRKLKGVVGIENKHWAMEQKDQVSDYQHALEEKFPGVPRVLLFLTPEGRRAETADPGCPCPYVPCSYHSVIRALHHVEDNLAGDVQFFVSNLRRHFDKTLEGFDPMTEEIRRLVHALYCDPEHQTAIRHILDNVPTLGAIAKRIVKTVEEKFREMIPEQRFDVDYYPRRTGDQEIKFILTELAEKTSQRGFSLIYVLHPDRTKNAPAVPDIGDHVTVQLMAWCDRSEYRDNVDALKLTENLPDPIVKPYSWSQWRAIWAGGSYRLQDLADSDVEGCSGLFTEAAERTYTELKKAVFQKLAE